MGLSKDIIIGKSSGTGKKKKIFFFFFFFFFFFLFLFSSFSLNSPLPIAFGVVALDDCNFHEVVNLNEFEKTKTISFSPPDGESVIMNYRCSGDFTTPFRVFPFLEEVMSSRLDLVLRLRADIPQSLFGNNVVVRVAVPKSTTSCSADFAGNAAGQSFEYKGPEKQAVWKIKRFGGGTEESIRIKVYFFSFLLFFFFLFFFLPVFVFTPILYLR